MQKKAPLQRFTQKIKQQTGSGRHRVHTHKNMITLTTTDKDRLNRSKLNASMNQT